MAEPDDSQLGAAQIAAIARQEMDKRGVPVQPVQVALLGGAGSPEGAVAAPRGAVYARTDGAPGSTLYVKEEGAEEPPYDAEGWEAK